MTILGLYTQEHGIQHRRSQIGSFQLCSKILNNEPIIALFDAGGICTCTSHHSFQKISDRVNMTKMSVQVNTSGGTTLDPIGIVINLYIVMYLKSTTIWFV